MKMDIVEAKRIGRIARRLASSKSGIVKGKGVLTEGYRKALAQEQTEGRYRDVNFDEWRRQVHGMSLKSGEIKKVEKRHNAPFLRIVSLEDLPDFTVANQLPRLPADEFNKCYMTAMDTHQRLLEQIAKGIEQVATILTERSNDINLKLGQLARAWE